MNSVWWNIDQFQLTTENRYPDWLVELNTKLIDESDKIIDWNNHILISFKVVTQDDIRIQYFPSDFLVNQIGWFFEHLWEKTNTSSR